MKTTSTKPASYMKQIVERFPDFEQALVGLGGVYLESQKPDPGTRSCLKRAIKLNPKDEVAWYRIAQAERAAGHPNEGQQKAFGLSKH